MARGDPTEQVREILANKEASLEDLGGSMDDVTVTRFYVREDVLSRETRATIHEVRSEFFDRPHYPASTMLGVADLVDPDALVEVEIRAEIPEDEWNVTVLTGEE